MVNRREKEVAEKYKEDGWTPVRCGAPDWLMIRTNDSNIEEVKFVEVKAEGRGLRYEQAVWKKALEKLGANFEVEVVK